MEEKKENEVSRRSFLGIAACVSAIGTLLVSILAALRFYKPALLPEGESVLKIGKASDFVAGTDTLFKEKNVIISADKDGKGLSAISLVCTHLGCIVKREESKSFTCPCHGSKYDKTGKVTKGPAPKDLLWYELRQLPNGQIAVNFKKSVPRGTKFSFTA